MNNQKTQQFAKFYIKDIKMKLNKESINKNIVADLSLSVSK